MHLGDLREFVEKAELTFDVDGRHFTVAPVSASVYLRLQAVQSLVETGETGDESVSKISAVDLQRMILGDTFDEIVEAGVSGAELQHIARAAHYWQLGANEIAERLWSAGKAAAPDGAESTSTTPTGSTSSESESVTLPPVSTTATTSRPKSKRNSTRTKAAATP